MPFRMSGAVTWCGNVGSLGLLCGPTLRVSFTLGTVEAQRGSSVCLEKVTLSWTLIKTCPPRRLGAFCSSLKKHAPVFWSSLKKPPTCWRSNERREIPAISLFRPIQCLEQMGESWWSVRVLRGNRTDVHDNVKSKHDNKCTVLILTVFLQVIFRLAHQW